MTPVSKGADLPLPARALPLARRVQDCLNCSLVAGVQASAQHAVHTPLQVAKVKEVAPRLLGSEGAKLRGGGVDVELRIEAAAASLLQPLQPPLRGRLPAVGLHLRSAWQGSARCSKARGFATGRSGSPPVLRQTWQAAGAAWGAAGLAHRTAAGGAVLQLPLRQGHRLRGCAGLHAHQRLLHRHEQHLPAARMLAQLRAGQAWRAKERQ